MEGQASVVGTKPNGARELVQCLQGGVKGVDLGTAWVLWVQQGHGCNAGAWGRPVPETLQLGCLSSAMQPAEGAHTPPWLCEPPETAGPGAESWAGSRGPRSGL